MGDCGKEGASILNCIDEQLHINGGPITSATTKKIKEHLMGYWGY